MALFGSLTTVRAQVAQTPGFAVAFAYVEDLLREDSVAARRIRGIAAGESQKIELGAGVFAIEQVYQTKPRAEGFFESHRSYIDLQVVVAGQETMELADIARIAVRQPYNPERDLIVYEDTDAASLLRVTPGLAAIFFPVDVHMPSLRAGAEATLVRKTVVKIPVS